VLTNFTNEHYSVDAFNLHHEAISKSDCPADVCVELSKNFLDASHVIQRPAIEDPMPPFLLCLIAELGEDLLFDEVHQAWS
jgi:hypothetical protein